MVQMQSRSRYLAWNRPDSAGSTCSVDSRGRAACARRTVPGAKLPRESSPGVGQLVVADPDLLGAVQDLIGAEPLSDDNNCIDGHSTLLVGEAEEPRVSSGDPSQHYSGSKGSRESRRLTSSIGGSRQATSSQPRKSRSTAEMNIRREELERLRMQDQQSISSKIEHRKVLREENFNRMFQDIMGHNALRHNAALLLREWQDSNEKLRRDTYNAWDEKIYEPMAKQAYAHMNDHRRKKQQLYGKKSVKITVPGERTTLFIRNEEDPMKAQLVEKAREDLIVQEFDASFNPGINRSWSVPALTAQTVGAPGSLGAGYADTAAKAAVPQLPQPPLARSRPVLEPMEWVPPRLQGVSCCGHFAQICEQGLGFRRPRKGGSYVHAPDETDGVEAAGKTLTRTIGKSKEFNCLGTLKADFASRGEAAQRKTLHGTSSGAPAQDHFTFSRDHESVDLEFPLGKKVDYPRV